MPLSQAYQGIAVTVFSGSKGERPAPKAGALPTALHPVIQFFIRLGVFSQSKRATNCANPGFWGIQFCSRCGQTCGQAVFLTTSTCERSACVAGVSRDCGDSVFRLEGGATRSQSRRATNCATPGYFVILSGWSYSPKPGAIPASLYPDMRVSADKHSAIIAKAAGECKHFLILKKN